MSAHAHTLRFARPLHTARVLLPLRPRTTTTTSTSVQPHRHLSTTAPHLNYWKTSFHRHRISKDKTDGRYSRLTLLSNPGFRQGTKPAKALSTRMHEMLSSNEVPTDFGTFPQTVIATSVLSMPGRPGILQSPRALLTAQARLVWRRLRDIGSVLVYKFGNGRPWFKLKNREIAAKTKKQYVNLYNALTRGKASDLDKFACDGVVDQCRTMIENRQGRPMSWALVRWVGRPKIVSSKATFLPNFSEIKGRKFAIRQAVVLLTSIQRFKDKEGRRQEKKIEEYVVMQRTVAKGVEGDWMIQSLADPTQWADLDSTLAPPTSDQTLEI